MYQWYTGAKLCSCIQKWCLIYLLHW